MGRRIGMSRLLPGAGVLGALALFLAAAFVAGTLSGSEMQEEEDGRNRLYYDGDCYVQKDGMDTLLFIGIDKFSDGEGSVHGEYAQADFLLLLVMDRKNGTCRALHLNRDTVVDYELLDDDGRYAGMTNGQIALSHAYGVTEDARCRNTARAVGRLLYGIPINNYVSLTMDGIGPLTDLVSGVEVDVPEEFAGFLGMEHGGNTVLTGDDALTFVRTRREVSDGSNLARMNRQRLYMAGLLAKFQDGMKIDLNQAYGMLEPYIETSCSIERMNDIAVFLQKQSDVSVSDLEGSVNTTGMYAEFYPDENSLRMFVLDWFYEKE